MQWFREARQYRYVVHQIQGLSLNLFFLKSTISEFHHFFYIDSSSDLTLESNGMLNGGSYGARVIQPRPKSEFTNRGM